MNHLHPPALHQVIDGTADRPLVAFHDLRQDLLRDHHRVLVTHQRHEAMHERRRPWAAHGELRPLLVATVVR